MALPQEGYPPYGQYPEADKETPTGKTNEEHRTDYNDLVKALEVAKAALRKARRAKGGTWSSILTSLADMPGAKIWFDYWREKFKDPLIGLPKEIERLGKEIETFETHVGKKVMGYITKTNKPEDKVTPKTPLTEEEPKFYDSSGREIPSPFAADIPSPFAAGMPTGPLSEPEYELEDLPRPEPYDPTKPPEPPKPSDTPTEEAEDIGVKAGSYEDYANQISTLLDAMEPWDESKRPDRSDPKYNSGNKDYDDAAFAFDDGAYNAKLDEYIRTREAQNLQLITLKGLAADVAPPDKDLTPFERETVKQWGTETEARNKEFKASREDAGARREHNADLIRVAEGELEQKKAFQEGSLALEEIRIAIDQGQFKLAAEKAAALHSRELRAQTMQFLGQIVNTPGALASLMQSEHGQEMLRTLGFGAMTEGGVPQSLSRFFSGGTPGAGPSYDPWSPHAGSGQAVMGMTISDYEASRLAEAGITDGTTYDEWVASLPPASREAEAKHRRATLEPKRKAIAGQTDPGRFDVGAIRDPGALMHPNMQQWKQLIASGQTADMYFESGLAGVSKEELDARIESTRPGVAIRKPQRMFSRPRFR